MRSSFTATFLPRSAQSSLAHRTAAQHSLNPLLYRFNGTAKLPPVSPGNMMVASATNTYHLTTNLPQLQLRFFIECMREISSVQDKPVPLSFSVKRLPISYGRRKLLPLPTIFQILSTSALQHCCDSSPLEHREVSNFVEKTYARGPIWKSKEVIIPYNSRCCPLSSRLHNPLQFRDSSLQLFGVIITPGSRPDDSWADR
jgi:hypothetical protein